MLEELESKLNDELVTWAAGIAVFCPDCEAVLDRETTLLINDLVTCTHCTRPGQIAGAIAAGMEVIRITPKVKKARKVRRPKRPVPFHKLVKEV